ncbi:amidohydrolase [Limnovirga soli]|uniref:Amidohydrolase family protein n=1 Tax=Limnovirga soli TaxID=2656915 RepID=A0A8J8JWX7_9BACT|nr:amidohydrolase [Limnovirga soli]NNV55776.1 amidohydrolase family protein [Limnovirga soli]
MSSTIKIALSLLFFLLSIKTQAQETTPINSNEKILFNAKIFTANTKMPYAEAVAIKGNLIVAIGNFNEVKNALSNKASLINMNGQCILPGFIDSHNHALQGGDGLLHANLYDSAVTIEALEQYATKVTNDGSGMFDGFLIIEGINIGTWSHIDELNNTFNAAGYAAKPILLRGSDGHTIWANNFLLQKAGITTNFISQLPLETKKYYGINPNNAPNGFIADSGIDKLNAILPEIQTDWVTAGSKAMEYLNSNGITAFLDPACGSTDATENEMLQAYQKLSATKQLTTHVTAVVVADANGNAAKQIANLKKLQLQYNNTRNLRVLGFKIFADGVIEYPTQTAALSKPYTNSGSNGALMVDPLKFNQFVTAADKANLLVHVHAIGDLAVTDALNGFAAARKINGNSHIPHTITHIQIAQPTDFTRFKQLGVLASLQLLWALGDITTIDIVQPYIAPELYKWQYPARSLLQSGATICGASDWPVTSANPFIAIYDAETRLGLKGVLDSTQAMPRIDMLYAYTINAARALQMDKQIGSLEPGKMADLILLDRDIFTISPEAMQQTKVQWTMFEGRIVYQQQ